MTEFDPIMNEAYREYADLRLRRHYLLLDAKEDSHEAAVGEQRMEELWAGFDDVQRRSLSGMGSDLNWLRRNCTPPPKGRKTPDEVSPAESLDLSQAMKSKEWHRILHYLRVCAPTIYPPSLASERRTAYEAIGLPNYASAFAQAINPANLFTKVYREYSGVSFVFLQEIFSAPVVPLFQTSPRPECHRFVVTAAPVSTGDRVRVCALPFDQSIVREN